MSAAIKQNFPLFLSLFRQLRSYGLNPQDWHFETTALSDGEIQMYHRQDNEFRFHGELSRSSQGELIIRHLKLASW